jgi:hypothetical protein
MKLKSFYESGRRPPLKEAYYISRTPPDFFEQLINECEQDGRVEFKVFSSAFVSIFLRELVNISALRRGRQVDCRYLPIISKLN